MIKILLKDRDIHSAIKTILKSCGLPTDYIDSIYHSSTPPKENVFDQIKYKNDIDFTKVNENHPIYAHMVMQHKIREAQDALKLGNWLRNNYKDALSKTQKGAAYRAEIKTLRKVITDELELREIKWECGWNDTHFRGCLLSFMSLVEHHPEIRNVLKGKTQYLYKLQLIFLFDFVFSVGRILVFSFFTGVSLDGHIMLYSGEVRHNWLDVRIILLFRVF